MKMLGIGKPIKIEETFSASEDNTCPPLKKTKQTKTKPRSLLNSAIVAAADIGWLMPSFVFRQSR